MTAGPLIRADGSAPGPVRAGQLLHFERRALGSPLRLSVHGLSAGEAAAAWRRIGAEVEAVDEAMSRFRSDSEVTRLNETAGSGTLVPVSRRLYAALAAADRAWRRTDGRFDPRVLVDLDRLGHSGAPISPPVPTSDEVSPDEVSAGEASAGEASAGEASAGEVSAGAASPAAPAPRRAAGRTSPDGSAVPWLRRDPHRRAVALAAPVDLGGIGKGLALRWAWRSLHAGARPPSGALLEAGGDIALGGEPAEGGPWLVGIEDPRGGDPPLAVVALSAGAVCTSSARIGRWRAPDGRLVHHLIDPRTGEPGGAGLLAVTVAGPDPAWAEVWSKALFLAGGTGVAEAARREGLAAWWVTEEGSLEMTAAGRQRTSWTSGR